MPVGMDPDPDDSSAMMGGTIYVGAQKSKISSVLHIRAYTAYAMKAGIDSTRVLQLAAHAAAHAMAAAICMHPKLALAQVPRSQATRPGG